MDYYGMLNFMGLSYCNDNYSLKACFWTWITNGSSVNWETNWKKNIPSFNGKILAKIWNLGEWLSCIIILCA
jgi:hypothetical protein